MSSPLVKDFLATVLTEGHIMTLTQQSGYPNLIRNSFCILFPAKGIANYISSRHYVHFKGTCSLAGRALLNTGK